MIEVATGRTLETKGNRNESVGGWRLTTPCMKLLNVECGKNLEMNNHRSSINRPQPLLQDCSTSHPTSANHLRGRANPHLSCKNYPSGLITEASDHPSPANHRHHSTFVFSSPFAALRSTGQETTNRKILFPALQAHVTPNIWCGSRSSFPLYRQCSSRGGISSNLSPQASVFLYYTLFPRTSSTRLTKFPIA